MSDKAGRARRGEQRREVEQSQKLLRQSIAETERLVAESDAMLERHHREREDDDPNTSTSDRTVSATPA